MHLADIKSPIEIAVIGVMGLWGWEVILVKRKKFELSASITEVATLPMIGRTCKHYRFD